MSPEMVPPHPTAGVLKHCQRALRRLSQISQWSPAEKEAAELRCRRHAQRVRTYFNLTEADRRAAARSMQSEVLGSFDGRFSAALRTHANSDSALVPLKPLSLDQLHDKASGWSPFSPIKGKATLQVQPKPDGRKRLILVPGFRVRAAQRLVLDCLPSWVESGNDFNARGRGTLAALREVRRMIEELGAQYVVVFDVKDFFPSVGPGHLKWLPLPKQVIGHTVFYGRHADIVPHNLANEVKTARQGLPHGATLSGRIGSALLGRELHDLGGELGKVIYVDDGVIGASTLAEAEAIAETIEKRLGNLPGGPLDLKRLEVCDVGEGFSFLGHWVRVRSQADQLLVSFKPSHSARMKARRELEGRLKCAGVSELEHATALAGPYLSAWVDSFPLSSWTPSEIETLEFEALSWVADYLAFGPWKKHYPINLPI